MTGPDRPNHGGKVTDMHRLSPDQSRLLSWHTLAVVALVVGGVTGYAISARHSPKSTAVTPMLSPTGTPKPYPTVLLTGRKCATRLGHQLQLGVELTNDTTLTVSLQAIDVGVPFGGLRVLTKQFGTCGNVGGNTGPQPLAPGNSAWMSATFDAHLPCRGTPPDVIFTAHYDGDKTATGGFTGLPDIAYSGCSAAPG